MSSSRVSLAPLAGRVASSPARRSTATRARSTVVPRERSAPRASLAARAFPPAPALASHSLSCASVVCRAYAAPTPGGASEPDAEDWSSWFKSFKKARWDEAPKPWKEFWATRVAAAVVEVDVDKESVSAKEVEGIGLNAPKDKAEALERFRHNLVVYRQNYAVAVWFCALLSNLTNPLAVVALLSAAGAAACASDVLLGELSLATNDTLTWNKTRVAGLDRSGAKNALSAVASVAGAATMYYSAADVIFGIVWGVSLAIFHSLFRPIDLKSTLNTLWEDAKGVQSREEAAALARKGVKGLQSWWKNRRPNEPTPVVMNVKGDPNAAYNQAGFAGAAAQEAAREEARRRAAEEDDDVVDTEGWTKPDSRGELPGGGR